MHVECVCLPHAELQVWAVFLCFPKGKMHHPGPQPMTSGVHVQDTSVHVLQLLEHYLAQWVQSCMHVDWCHMRRRARHAEGRGAPCNSPASSTASRRS